MKDERAHLQLFDLIARDWVLPSVAQQITFNATDTAVAFACADGSVHLAATADKASPNQRIRRAVDSARLTIAPREAPFPPLKLADFTTGRSSTVVPCGPVNFAFAKFDGRINTLTPGGIAVHLPLRQSGEITALAVAPDGLTVAFAAGSEVRLSPIKSDTAALLPVKGTVRALAFAPDGLTLAAAHDAGVTLWQVAAPTGGAVDIPMAPAPVSLIWSGDGAWLGCCLDTDGIGLIDIASHTLRRHGGFPAPVRSVAFSAPTQTVVASGAFRVAGWSLADDESLLSGKPGLVLINAVATAPNRNLVAVGYANGLLSLAEIGRPSEILLREDTGAGITAMTWSHNGSYLALAGSDGSAALVEFPDSMFKS